MRRRTWAGVLAAVLVLGLAVVALSKPVPYVTFKPGPTVNVLGKSEDKEIIKISGHKTYDDDGALRLVTVIPSGPQEKVSIAGLVSGWISPDVAVYPYRAIYQATDTRQSVRQQSSIEMVSSQDSAVAAALNALHIPYKSGVKIASVQKGGPADGKLKADDFVVAVDGKRVSDVDQLTKAIRPLPVGSDVRVTVRRGQTERKLTMTTASSPQDKKNSAVLVSIAPGYQFPFDVDLNLAQNIGGPSAGTMFALGIYDALTPGSLTRGKVIAGTGEIDAQGKVGEIGGIQQKLVGAQNDGAELFLVPAANCAEAVKGHYDPDKMRLVKVSNLQDAIKDVKTWAKNPDADLPKCAA
jgi:PDZ domain-containing protein